MLVNLWRYADQQFWFHNGALTARGINESGKTKALELTLPLLLHANTDPAWLDPFGGRTKKMAWNLAGWRSDSSGNHTGYSCIEFGRLNSDGTHSYVTIGGGFKVTTGNPKVVSWWWTVENRRVDRDLEIAPSGEPLSASGLGEVLDSDGTVWPTASAYRAEVDRLLFGIGPDRYDSLVHLLLQLRRPNLAEKIDVDSGALSQLLAESLSPVDRTVVARSAEQFARLESHQEAVTRLEATQAIFDTFDATYRPWVKRVVLDAAMAYRLSFNRHKDQTAKESRLAERVRSLQDHLDELATLIEISEARIDELAATRSAIDTSSIEELERLRTIRNDAQTEADRCAGQIASTTDRLDRVKEKASQLATKLAAAREELATATRQLDLDFIGVDVPALDSAGDLEAFRGRVEGAIETRQVLLRQARKLLATLGAALTGLNHAREALTAAETDLDVGTTKLDRLESEAANAVDEWAESAEAWWTALVDAVPTNFDTPLPTSTIPTATDLIAAGQHPSLMAMEPWADIIGEFTSARTRLGLRIDEFDSQIATVDDEIDDLRNRPLIPPDRRPGVPADRAGTPFWQAVDFADNVGDETRANIEAALEASGLLDALVDDHGLDGLDTRIDVRRIAPVSTPLSTVLTAETSADPIVAEILDRIGIAEGAGDVWVSPNGSWHNGAASGRWTKPAAAHIGETARGRARDERIRNLGTQRLQLVDRVDATRRELELLEAAAIGFQQTVAEFPDPTAPLDLVRSAVSQRELLGDLHLRVDQANAQVRGRTQTWRTATDAAHEALIAVGVARSQDATDRLDAQSTALSTAQSRLTDLRIAASGCFSLVDDVADQHDEKRRIEYDLEQANAAHTTAVNGAAAARAAHKAAEASLGEDARAKAKQRNDLLDQINSTKAELTGARTDRESTIRDHSTAEADLANHREERARLAAARDDQLAELRTILATEFGVIAIGAAMELPHSPTYDSTLRIAQELISRIDDPGERDGLRHDVQVAFGELIRTEAGARVHVHHPEGICQVLVPTIDAGNVDVTVRARQIAKEAADTADLLDRETRRLIDGFLLDQVAEHLVDRVAAADRLVAAMNATLRERIRPGRESLEFRWVPSKDLLESDREAVGLFHRDIVGGDDRSTVADFLERRIQDARTDDSGDLESRLRDALDYRSWFTFTISVIEPGGTVKKLTSSTQSSGSGGSRDRILALALFATVSAFYDSTRDRKSPRLFMLDEAFSKVSEDNIRDCLALARDLDLDWFFTSHNKWFTYAEVPGLAIYDIHRNHSAGTVTPVRFVWDGIQKRPEDPWRDAL